MYLTIINRGMSLVIAIGYVAIDSAGNGFGAKSFKLSICLFIVLCLIWFGEQMGSFTGYVGRGGNIDVETPGWIVCLFGWVLLIGIPIILYFMNKR